MNGRIRRRGAWVGAIVTSISLAAAAHARADAGSHQQPLWVDGFSTDVVGADDAPLPPAPTEQLSPPPDAAEPVAIPLPPPAWTGLGCLAIVALVVGRKQARRFFT